MDDDELADLLERFGLSEKETDTYLAILEHGESKASTIADAADVSKRYVYSISEELEERGFVEVDDHAVPTVIRPVQPETVVERLTRSVEEIEPELESRFTATERSGEQFEVIKSRQTVIKRIESLLANAETEVTLSLPAEVLPRIRSTLEATVDRGVLVLLLLGATEGDQDIASLAGTASTVRTWDALVPTMLTVDGRHGLLAPSQILTTSASDTRAIAISQEQLAPVLAGSFLANYWPTAEERYVTTPNELPCTYEGFRSAVFQIALHRATDTRIEASVTGSPVGDRDLPSSLSGEVVEVRQSLVRPVSSTLPIENAFELEVDGDRYTVGGTGAFLEDYEAESVTIRALEE
ncbi:transcriptional regulator, TrmB [Haloterrigena turkmenica DSM 5511]|uniref:Transcriptional regulator, TrmB n=1 Tax=Haloterrigena turkmenica (strain ATCC 51198 / DSM 5511 / JCM 9101 / NCIMB 13204 / VKM B-1734 / 4k) TaxID=543526 RepID=D2RWM1_HALTV|nr:TrmB family transcriptional regulator sugar-binding domain-containing protein [Haloterrigena turkmenica]ADB61522.1 transcriptional regulator, TrmB [Haloterrigena turkmenica DSM 5511]